MQDFTRELIQPLLCIKITRNLELHNNLDPRMPVSPHILRAGTMQLHVIHPTPAFDWSNTARVFFRESELRAYEIEVNLSWILQLWLQMEPTLRELCSVSFEKGECILMHLLKPYEKNIMWLLIVELWKRRLKNFFKAINVLEILLLFLSTFSKL